MAASVMNGRGSLLTLLRGNWAEALYGHTEQSARRGGSPRTSLFLQWQSTLDILPLQPSGNTTQPYTCVSAAERCGVL